jgi:hypothetical protein
MLVRSVVAILLCLIGLVAVDAMSVGFFFQDRTLCIREKGKGAWMLVLTGRSSD